MSVVTVLKKNLTVVCIVILVIAIGSSVYFYSQYQIALYRLAHPSAATTDDTKALMAKVSSLMLLPPNEQPTVATVTDKEKLKDQPLFTKAENGDKVLVFTKAMKAILYRPSTNQIIEVGPISFTQQSATASATPADKLTVVLYNGTQVVGLTKKYETTLKTKVPSAQVTDRGNTKGNYDKSVVVDVAPAKSVAVSAAAAALGLPVGPLPAGESTPSADMLIILGADMK